MLRNVGAARCSISAGASSQVRMNQCLDLEGLLDDIWALDFIDESSCAQAFP